MNPDGGAIVAPIHADATAGGDTDRPTVHVARQPILDRETELVGYELLFRGPLGPGAGRRDHLHATSKVIVDGLIEVGLLDLVGTTVAHLNVTRDLLLDLRPLPLPAERIVLELIDHERADDRLIEVLGELREQSFTIAIDNYRPTRQAEALLGQVQMVKIDVLEYTGKALEDLVAQMREYGPGPTLVAEKVETNEDFERCRELGFDAFQGYFFARPTRVGRERIPCEGLGALRTMADLNATEDFDQLHRIITRDAGLSMRLLRYANSAFVSLPRRVGSVQEAMLWLGASTVRNFALMVALAGARDVPSELLVTALVRARMCELMSGVCDAGAPDSSFTVGLFSVADALANRPMGKVIAELPFRDDIAAALVRKEGKHGDLLGAVIAYERGDFGAAAAFARGRCDVEEVYREAVKWADLSFAGLV
jgi:c-di-GMP phosphodiesterase